MSAQNKRKSFVVEQFNLTERYRELALIQTEALVKLAQFSINEDSGAEMRQIARRAIADSAALCKQEVINVEA